MCYFKNPSQKHNVST